MQEFEVVLVPTSQEFHILNFPLTDLQQFEQVYQLSDIEYKPISTAVSLHYESTQSSDDRLEKDVHFQSQIINNRTYYLLTKLDEINKRIYVYPIQNFQNMRVKVSEEILQQEQQQAKRGYRQHYEIKSKENSIKLEQNEIPIPIPKIIESTKQMSQNEYYRSVFE